MSKDKGDLFPTPEERNKIYTIIVGDNDEKTDRPLQVFYELLGEPKGLSGKKLGSRLKPPVQDTTVRHFVRPLRTKLCEEFFVGECRSEPFFIELAENPYRLLFWRKETLKSDEKLKARIARYQPATIPSGGLKSLVGTVVTVWEDWKRFEELLAETKSDPNEKHDLRILTTAFPFRADEDQPILKLLVKLLKDGVKISILLINPRNVSLAEARFRLREDLHKVIEKRTAKRLDDLYDQIGWLSDQATKFPNLKIKLINTMPLGSVAVNAERALIGLFVATTSYSHAPHIEAGNNTVLWTTLKKEWDDRWTDKETIGLAEFSAFDEFWGRGATKDAKIVVQTDNIETLGSEAGAGDEESCLRKIRRKPSSRGFKARAWVNKYDIQAAIAIRDQFHRQGIPAPDVVQLPRKRDDVYPDAPFVISLGLGFTDQTITIRDRCDGWLSVTYRNEPPVERPSETGCGDALSLNNKLLSFEAVKKQIERLKLEPQVDPKNKETFHCFIPAGWTLDRWLGKETYSCPDYAIIFRYTVETENGKPQRHFMVGGFSERGTAVAGRYLVDNWKKIHDRVGKDDFLVVITGPSNPSDLGKWSSVKDCCIITPDHVRDAALTWDRFITL